MNVNFRQPYLHGFTCAAAIVSMFALGGAEAWGIDSVIRKSTEKPAGGEITSITRTEVVVTPRIGSPVTVPANDIDDVDWDGAPPSLNLGQSQESVGQLDSALKSYEEAEQESSGGKEGLRAEIAFSIARVNAKLAFADESRREAAKTLLVNFTDRYRSHYRFYDAQLLLGRVALAADDEIGAEAAFDVVIGSPWTDYQMAGKIGRARIELARGQVAAAKAAFNDVAGKPASTPAEASQRLEAMVGQAKCLQAESNHAEAVTILDQVVKQSSTTDVRLQAEAYLRQGDAYAALGGREEDAVMSYLHVDVLPSLAQQKDLHAEALYQLSRLWPAVGKPERGQAAAEKLGQNYPDSEWAKQLGGG